MVSFDSLATCTTPPLYLLHLTTRPEQRKKQLTASILAVREVAVPFCGEQCAAMHTHSSKQESASSARDSEGADDVFFFVPLSPPPLVLPFPFEALAAAAASLAAPDVFPVVTCVHAAT